MRLAQKIPALFRGSRIHWTALGLSLYAMMNLTSMATMNIAAVVLVVLLICDGGWRQFWNELTQLFKNGTIRKYTDFTFALVIVCFLSLLFAQLFPLTFIGKEPQEFAVPWFRGLGKMWYFFFPFFLLLGWKRLSLAKQGFILKIWLISFGVLSFVGIFQFFTGWLRSQPNPLLPGYYHPIMLLGHHLSVASIWIFPFFVSLECWVNREARLRIQISRLWLTAFLGSALFVLILGYSRTLWVSLPVGLIFWALLRLPKRLSLLVVIGVVFLSIILFHIPAIQERIHHHMGVGDRVELWKANWDFFKSRPFFGVGLTRGDGLSYYYFQWKYPTQNPNIFFIGHAHNLFLELLSGIGILGLVAWLFWMGYGISLFVRGNSFLKFGVLAAWFVFLLNSLTQVNFWESKVLHQVMWIYSFGLLSRLHGAERVEKSFLSSSKSFGELDK